VHSMALNLVCVLHAFVELQDAPSRHEKVRSAYRMSAL